MFSIGLENPKYISLGSSITGSIRGIRRHNLNTEFFFRYNRSDNILQITTGYCKNTIDVPSNAYLRTTLNFTENVYNKVDGYFMRIGIQKRFNQKIKPFKRALKYSIGLNVNSVLYRQKLKVEYDGYYVDNYYSYKQLRAFSSSIESELNLTIWTSKSQKFSIEACNRFGVFLIRPKFGHYTSQIPGIRYIFRNAIHYGLFNICMHVRLMK